MSRLDDGNRKMWDLKWWKYFFRNYLTKKKNKKELIVINWPPIMGLWYAWEEYMYILFFKGFQCYEMQWKSAYFCSLEVLLSLCAYKWHCFHIMIQWSIAWFCSWRLLYSNHYWNAFILKFHIFLCIYTQLAIITLQSGLLT